MFGGSNGHFLSDICLVRFGNREGLLISHGMALGCWSRIPGSNDR